MLRLSLDALEIIDAIDRHGSFAAAGKEVFRVPSTISYSVAKLEEDLGVQLFERVGPKATLTNAGRELLKEGRYLLKAAGDLERRVRRVSSGWETELVIGIDSIFSAAALKDDIIAFYKIADQTRLRVTQDSLSGTWESLLEGRVDLLIGAPGEGPPGGGFTAEPMGKIRFVFTVSPMHPLAAVSHPLGKSDLGSHRAISVADSARTLAPRTVGILFGQDTLAVPDMRTKFHLQLAGVGFGFLPELCARQAIHAGLLIEKEVEEPKPDEIFYLAWRTGEEGAALNWWREQMRNSSAIDRLSKFTFEETI
jgi:DNA-binding transcriptional LysR family regulator